MIDTFLERFKILSYEEQLSLLSQYISVHSKTHHKIDLPDDFIPFCLSAMKNLDSHGKTNKCLVPFGHRTGKCTAR